MAGRSLSPEARQNVISLYLTGLSIDKVCVVTSHSKTTILKVLKEEGILRKKGWNAGRKPVHHPDLPPPVDSTHLSWRVIPDLVAGGLPVPSVAKMLNVGEDYVRFCLRRESSSSPSSG